MKKFILTFLLIALLCALCACNEQQQPEAPACDELGHEMAYTSNSSVHVYKCTREGCTYAEAPKAHRGGSATCTAPGICTDCGMEYQKKTEHIFAGATCTELAKCTVCGATGGELLSHNYEGATCTALGKCTACGATGGELLSHNYEGATCTALGKCTACGATGGELLPHNYIGATCIAQGSCSVCGVAGGGLSDNGHNVVAVGEPCTLCGEDYYNATLKFELMADGKAYAVTGIGSCEATELIIPAEHRGKPIVEIADEAFYSKNADAPILITQLVIPDSIESIGKYAFAGCKYLKEVNLPSTIKRLEDCTFMMCTSLEAIELPDTLQYIGESALESTAISAIDLPYGIEFIGSYAFASMPIESIVIPDSVREMGEYALSSLYLLKSVTVPGSVKNIPEGLLDTCESLTDVVFEEGVTSIAANIFGVYATVERISIPDSIEFVNNTAFESCDSLQYNVMNGWGYLGNAENPTLVLCKRINGTELITPDDTKIILDLLAYDADEITSIGIGASVCYIGNMSLIGLDGVTNVEVSPENTTYYTKNKCIIERGTNKLLYVFRDSVIPDDGSITLVDLSIYTSLETIKSIVIPKGVKEVLVAMCNCRELSSIVIGPDVQKVTFGDNVRNGRYKVFVCNTEEKWTNDIIILPEDPGVSLPGITIGGISNDFIEADHYFYSETEPTSYGKFWHYVNGVPTPW